MGGRVVRNRIGDSPMTRVALITNVLSHYRVPCFGRLSQALTDRIAFFFLTKEMSHRSYVLTQGQPSFPTIWLKGWNFHRPPDDDRHLNDIRPVIKGRYDVIVLGGWDELTYLLLWLWGCFLRKKVLFWIESTARDSLRRGFKEYYKQLLLRHAAGCIVPGKRAFEYCTMLGMPEDRVFIAPNATDRDYFRRQSDRLLPLRQAIRAELGVNGVAILYVGRLVEEYKNISTLLIAFDKLVRGNKPVSLLVVGEGIDKDRYESLVKKQGIHKVRFLGQLNHEQLCRIYTASDILVLPSRSETWGFVLNEGMEFGLPLVVSEAVGAGPDLVSHGENGFVFPVGDVDALAAALELLAQNEALRKKMGQKSRQIIEDFSPENWAKGVMKAITSVSERSR